MKEELYVCDSLKKIADGKCNGHGCTLFKDCFMTSDINYAKEYISIYEAEKYFESMIEIHMMNGNQEKAKQYANALKSIKEAIKDMKDDSEVKESVFIDCLYEQTSLFKELL